jgi:phosphatidylinositol alpha-1,6-mannosyltransferase
MRVCVVLEYRFARTPDGMVWARLAFDNAFWHRYLQVFDAVRVVARAEDVADPPAGAKAVEGDRVCFRGVPFYHGMVDGLRQARAVRRATIAAVDPDDAVIFRVPSFVSAPLWRHRVRTRRPYGVEVVGDPWDVFAPGAVTTPLRPLMRRYFARQMRRQCAKAAAAAYVTSGYLQSSWRRRPRR